MYFERGAPFPDLPNVHRSCWSVVRRGRGGCGGGTPPQEISPSSRSVQQGRGGRGCGVLGFWARLLFRQLLRQGLVHAGTCWEIGQSDGGGVDGAGYFFHLL